MATLVFSAIGRLIGGPLGGAIGALVGQQVDTAIIGSPTREGPRLKELAVTTSSYGAPIARVFGTMRVPGTIIWATDLVEHRDRSGGGKGKPSVVNYSYTASFAVALASRELAGIGRIWADGNLLRGSAGDLKAGGAMRFHAGTAGQDADPLIAAAVGLDRCPAHRGVSYVVFEDLELGDFGNRIPALSFEVFAGDGTLRLADLAEGVIEDVSADVPLTGIVGLSCEGSLADLLGQLDPAIPFDCDVSGEQLVLGRQQIESPQVLGEAAMSSADDAFGAQAGYSRKRMPPPAAVPEAIRYYDVDRDFQVGLQRAPGALSPGQPQNLELPAALAATDARRLAGDVARRSRWARQSLSWRTAEIDPAIVPGSLVEVPGTGGVWRVHDWEWRETGVELTLLRAAIVRQAAPAADPGSFGAPADNLSGPTLLTAFELPWDGTGSGQKASLYAAATSAASGWSGAALFADDGRGQLTPLGPVNRVRAVMGTAENALEPASPCIFDRHSSLIVRLAASDLALVPANAQQVVRGANRALVGSEIVQFARATALGGGRWQLTGLLRGRGGTEAAIGDHAIGERFVLLDSALTGLDAESVGTAPDARIAAAGLADTAPARTEIACRGLTTRPLPPVHPRAAFDAGGNLELSWIRRSRGAWSWADGVDAPLNEQSEEYLVTLGDPAAPMATWVTTAPQLTVSAETLASLEAIGSHAELQVRQRGSQALSGSLPLIRL